MVRNLNDRLVSANRPNGLSAPGVALAGGVIRIDEIAAA